MINEARGSVGIVVEISPPGEGVDIDLNGFREGVTASVMVPLVVKEGSFSSLYGLVEGIE